ncbi:alpha/beta fold hydrolase [Desertihabitans aurantiacus]|uniref:alpha/beta fold hydrolase n=1 Tax=Desertihabitans aurantiacus TaxID=2282477 RepID=UPI000DF7A7CD|nr:alpha/beta hydrolase [Desertihabitans aurantiacus]
MDQESTTPTTPTRALGAGRRRLRRLLLGLVVVLLGGVLALTLALRTPSPVGHWRSAADHDAFLQTYRAAFADLPEPAETLDVRTDYGVVRMYRFEGSGDEPLPLVLLPGTASASPVWADNLPSLLRIGDVWTLDLLGEPGMSVQSRPITDHADQARWLDQALAGLPEPEVHLVGLSIGGWTAANLALREPTHLASLTLVDPVQVFGDIPLETVLRSLPSSVSWTPKAWRDSFNSYTAGGAPVEDVPVADMIESGMAGYALKLPQPSRIDPTTLAGSDLPVLVLLAGRSVMHDAATAIPAAERALPGRVRVYPDATHALNGEYPDELAADVAAFLAQQR